MATPRPNIFCTHALTAKGTGINLCLEKAKWRRHPLYINHKRIHMTKDYHHLTQFQRCQIATLKESGFSQTEIAKRINVHKSSVSRELKRNTSPCTLQASSVCGSRPPVQGKSHSAQINTGNDFLDHRWPEKYWSPEQICGRLLLEGGLISHESIYKLIWKNKRNGDFMDVSQA